MSGTGSSTAFPLHNSHRKEVCRNSCLYRATPHAGRVVQVALPLAAGTTPAGCTASGAARALFPRPTCALGSLGSLHCSAMLSLHSVHRRFRLSCHLLSQDCHCVPHHPGPRTYHRAKAQVFRSRGAGGLSAIRRPALVPTA